MHVHSPNGIRPLSLVLHGQVFCACLLTLSGIVLGSSPSAGRAQLESFTPTWPLVIDRANLLDASQEQTAVTDAWWLNSMGTPFQVVTESAPATPQSAQQRAADLRVDHRIESKSGADDGIVLYAAVNPENRSEVVFGVSAGNQATSGSGLTRQSLKHLGSTTIATQMNAGHPARAIVYSIREMMYLKTFVPPSAPSPMGWRADVHRTLFYAGPLFAIACAAATLFGLRRASNAPNARWVLAGSLATVASVQLILSVQAQSGAGVAAGLAIVAMSGLCATLADGQPRDPSSRTLVVTPRPPGTRLGTGNRS